MLFVEIRKIAKAKYEKVFNKKNYINFPKFKNKFITIEILNLIANKTNLIKLHKKLIIFF